MTKKEDTKEDKPAAAETTAPAKDKKQTDEKGHTLTESDIAILKKYGKGPYTEAIRKAEEDMKQFNQKITTLCGIKESDTGLALPSQWNLQQD
jgi:26S proteasome regulatory subunit T1